MGSIVPDDGFSGRKRRPARAGAESPVGARRSHEQRCDAGRSVTEGVRGQADCGSRSIAGRVVGDAQGRVDRQMVLFLECAPGDFGVADWFSSGPARGGGRPRNRAPLAAGSGRSHFRLRSGRKWSLSRRSPKGSAASIRALQPHRVGHLMRVVRPPWRNRYSIRHGT
jgi:hypothetical protein